MASLFPGFEYDIFISYRQKDNKHDGWVTEFVAQLKGELESTFKEEISVYFDINPHDGLLETHDVDASLKEKLRCLIFIPVISRTYCDPKAFAWEHEFLAFIQQASKDQFGLKVRLPNGNVASRILPVRIHDLDFTDIKLCESALGGVIRGVDFVYKEPGVNRPLTTDDDDKKNLNGTKYRNQINKTANAIKEIISGLKSEPDSGSKDKVKQLESWDNGKSEVRDKRITGIKIFKKKSIKWLALLIIMILCIIGANAVYKLINLATTSKTIAVLFSSEIINDSELMNIRDTYTEAIHTKLGAVKSLSVKSRSALIQYRNSERSLGDIRKELNINYLLYGNIRRNGDEIIIVIELTSEKISKQLWFRSYSWGEKPVSQISTEVVHNIVTKLHAKLSPDELNQIETEPSNNIKANQSYTLANSMSYYAWSSFTMANKYLNSTSFNSAIEAYDKVVKEDSLFAEAYAKRAIARSWGYLTGQLDSTHIGKCLDDIIKASNLNKDLPDVQIATGFYYYYCKDELDKALEYFTLASEKNPEDYQPLFYMALVYRRLGKWSKSQDLIRQVIDLNPQEALFLTNIGISYAYLHDYDSALIFHQKAIDLMPVWSAPYNHKFHSLILKNGYTVEARNVLDDAFRNTGDNFTELRIILEIFQKNFTTALNIAAKSTASDFIFEGDKYLYMAMIYNYLKNPVKAQSYFDSALICLEDDLARYSDNPFIHSYLGIANAGLGNKEQAITEGEKALELSKNNKLHQSELIINLSQIYTLTHEYEKAISTLEYLLINPSLFSIKLSLLDPVWEPLKDMPGFKTLVAKYSDN